MAQLIVRGLEDDIELRLRRRAANHGRSMEDEARDILRDALKHDDPKEARGLGTMIAESFRGVGLKPHEEIRELRGATLESPFGE